jgi:hypothetical protein
MYIVGHTALAYLILRPILALDKTDQKAVKIFYIFIFANIIDIINYNVFRYLGHNLIGTIIFSSFWMMVFYKLNLIKFKYFPLFFIATGTHVVADYLFTEYYFFVPFYDMIYSVFGYDTHYGLVAELILFLIFLPVFFGLGDCKRMKNFFYNAKQKTMSSVYEGAIIVPAITSLLFIAFFLFIIAQLAVFFVTNRYCITHCGWIPGTYIIAFILFIILFALIGFSKNSKVDS